MDNRLPGNIDCTWLRYELVNLSMHQNFVPIVQKISVSNNSEEDLSGVKIKLCSEPEFATEWSKTIDRLPAGRTVEIHPVPMQLSVTFLAELTERLVGNLTLEISHTDQILYQEVSPITVLAYDQWGGLAYMPEMIAAFIMPNHPVVAKLIGSAAVYLERWTGHPSFDAYQSKSPNRVRHQAAAIFSAIQELAPTYCVAPASFEEMGQRVRLPDTILESRLGNCLDLSLLYAACLEAVGLHPLIIFTEGHAFAGVWLVEEMFPEVVQDDISTLTKRFAQGVHDISLTECTLMCSGNSALYQEAETTAMSNLADADKFYGLVDVKRARGSAIRPLPLRIPIPQGWEIITSDRSEPELRELDAPQDVTIVDRPEEVSSIEVPKQKLWERKLLDLTLRNTLLNFRLTRAALPILNSQLSLLEDSLAEGTEFAIHPRPTDWDDTVRSADLFQSISHDHPLNTLLQQEFQMKRLRADADDRELYRKMTHLYRSARLSIEENGANTLYLALGLLKWYETPTSETARYAPIVLTPVEILRRSSSAGYVLRSRDDDPQVNITLLEMLRQDYGCHIDGLDPLPRDESGIDLHRIFTTVRHVIMNMPRWDIVESGHIGLFSFSRFVMWNDIRSRGDDLTKNKVVASLMSGRITWEQTETFLSEDLLDDRCPPEQLLLPISADSSQIAAVSAALHDMSFVLHGPPGTGKSQTITNLIAASLANGKTVLFVAEKMAALSVVQNRLEQIGLGPFCLELHSNKSTKRAVLEQLRLTLETARTASPEDWKKQAERLRVVRSELNEYVASLHHRYWFGASLFDAITHYGHRRAAPEHVRFESSEVEAMTDERFTSWGELIRQIVVAGRSAGHPYQHPWSDVQRKDYTPSLRTQAADLLAKYATSLSEFRLVTDDIARLLGLEGQEISSDNIPTIREIVELLHRTPIRTPASSLRAEDVMSASHNVTQAIEHGRAVQQISRDLLATYSDSVLQLDVKPALSEWREASLRWFLPKLMKQNRIFKLLKSHTQPTARLSKESTEQTLISLDRHRSEKTALAALELPVKTLLGPLWNDTSTDWDMVESVNEWTNQLYTALARLYVDVDQVKQARERLASSLELGVEQYLKKNRRLLERFLSAYNEIAELESIMTEMLTIDLRAMDRKRVKDQSWLDFRESKVAGWQGHLGQLRDWCSWLHVRNEALEAGLAPLVSAYEEGAIQHDEVEPAFERGWWMAVIQYIMDTDKRLASFSGRVFEEKIRTFQEIMERYEQLVRQEIAARLSANVPPMHHQAAASSEMGILLKAIRSGGRGVSLRKLFEQIPTLLTRLCPCFLMSPMSVAQYLDPKYAPFDLVVFDEASQLPTSEAVGAMARGHNVIVVGDPKQLPPTSFFTNTSTGEVDVDVTEDLESILDDCLALGMPQEHLLWHYRSRHESLIAFSNVHFYDNKLFTFPSPYERMSNVRWHYVEGYYDRGKTKQNRAEAEHIVAEIMNRLRDPERRKLSIGVVTFNSIQQTLIEDLLDQAFREHPELEEIALNMPESIFVKNLENVQGDERDVIMFSIGYGPDANGRVVLNFGPLNRDGGWRRLNVAVSRARQEMHVFSSLRADHLDVTRTRAEGVNALRSFLEYAERGASSLRVDNHRSSDRKIGIEEQIADELVKLGYKADTQVGASGYRIDLAVVDPGKSDTYSLAILCDGDMYKTARTARDRELLREQVLRQLGWNIHRVWAIDWFDNPDKELQRIVEAIQSVGEVEPLDSQPTEEHMEEGQLSETTEGTQPEGELSPNPSQGMFQGNTANPTTTWQRPYSSIRLERLAWTSDGFYQPINRSILEEQIKRVIEAEGPVYKQLLIKRILPAWGITRSGTRIDQYMTTLIQAIGLKTSVWDGREYYWPAHLDPDAYEWYRISHDDDDRRNADELPPEEIVNAIREVLFVQGSLAVDDLVRETVKLLGYSRTGAALDRVVRQGIQVARDRGYIEILGDRAMYV